MPPIPDAGFWPAPAVSRWACPGWRALQGVVQILKDLGLRRVRLLTNNPKKTDAFVYGGFDLEVVDQVPILPPVNEYNARYLATKRDKMGHLLPDDL